MKQLLLFFLYFGCCAGMCAQADSLQAKIAHLMEVSGAEQQFIASAMNMIDMQEQQPAFSAIPEGWWTEFKERVRQEGWRDIAPDLMQIYRENYTEAEIDYLIAYHSNPLTQAINAKMPTVQQQSMVVGQAWGEKIAQELAEKLESADD